MDTKTLDITKERYHEKYNKQILKEEFTLKIISGLMIVIAFFVALGFLFIPKTKQ